MSISDILLNDYVIQKEYLFNLYQKSLIIFKFQLIISQWSISALRNSNEENYNVLIAQKCKKEGK